MGQNNKKKYSLTILVLFGLIITISCASDITAYKMIGSSEYYISSTSLIYLFTYVILSSVTETYGYNVSKYFIWFGHIFQVIFVLAISALLMLPSAPISYQPGYEPSNYVILSHMPMFIIAVMIGSVAGSFSDVYFISKCKILVNGRLFILRVIGATLVGQFVESAIIFGMAFFFQTENLNSLLHLMFTAYIFNISYICLLSPVSKLLTVYLKKKEGMDIYDYNIKYNPFSFQQ